MSEQKRPEELSFVVRGYRQTGKTTQAVDWVMKNPHNRRLLVSCEMLRQDAIRILDKHYPDQPMATYGLVKVASDSSMWDCGNGNTLNFIVDDIDLLPCGLENRLWEQPGFSGYTESIWETPEDELANNSPLVL